MGEGVAACGRAEAVEQGADPAPRRLNEPCGRVVLEGFALGEALFNRGQIDLGGHQP